MELRVELLHYHLELIALEHQVDERYVFKELLKVVVEVTRYSLKLTGREIDMENHAE